MVTAELAACLPVLVLILGVVLSALAVGAGAARAQDAAREAARALARGDRAAAGRLVAAELPGARMTSGTTGPDVIVTVTAVVHPLGGGLPGIAVSGRAVAALEPAGSG